MIKDENMRLRWLMKTFVDVLMSNEDNNFLKMNYEEVLELEIRLVRNALVWGYDYEYFNVEVREKDYWKRASWDFKELLRTPAGILGYL